MEWGLEFIRAVQTIRSPALDAIFRSITSLGNEEFYFILLPLLLWCVDVAVGIRMAAVLLLSTYINVGLKDLLRLPRPFVLDPSVRLYEAEGYGMPSGHAQHATVIWGTLADALRRRWAWVGAALLFALIGFSRIYLGVHFPTDVLGGWLVGGVLLLTYVSLHRPIERWLQGRAFGVRLALVTLLSIALMLIHATDDTATVAGVLLGAGVGLVLLRRYVGYRTAGAPWKRGLRFVLGATVLVALRLGLGFIPLEGSATVQLAFRFGRYAVLGLWIALGAPWLFTKIRLAEKT